MGGEGEEATFNNDSTQVKVRVEFIYKGERNEKLPYLFIQMQKRD